MGAAIVALLSPLAILDCGSGPTGPCPLRVPTDKTECNSGGVSLYCHYDCVSGERIAYYALCSGATWSVTAYPVDCARDAGKD